MVYLLRDIFRRSQNLNDKEFNAGNALILGHNITVGRFGYRFNERGKATGGWIRNYTECRTSDWEQWAVLLNEPLP